MDLAARRIQALLLPYHLQPAVLLLRLSGLA